MRRFAGRTAYTLAFVLVGVAAAKMCQYAAVGLFEPRLGFELASLLGVAPFVAALLWARARYPRWFSFRDMGREGGGEPHSAEPGGRAPH